jgi:hypothetical protein
MQPPTLPPEEIVRRVTGLLEVDGGFAFGALAAGGGSGARGASDLVFSRYLAAFILVDRFSFGVEHAAILLNRERGTVTKALKVFGWLDGFQGWGAALERVGDLCENFVAYAAEREIAARHIPAPIGRVRNNSSLPAWARSRYAREIESYGEARAVDQARAQAEADNVYLRHPAVKAITNDPDLKRILGEPVVSVSLSPLEDATSSRPILIVPPNETTTGAIALRLLAKGESPSEMKAIMDGRQAISRALLKAGFRLAGVAESFASRDAKGWRYVPLHIAQVRS